MKPEHEQQAKAVADRTELADYEVSDDRISRNFLRLEQVISAFEAAADSPGTSREKLFRWRHLEVERSIDAGGFGEVFQAWDPTLERSVALKLVPKDVQSELRDRLMIAEAKRMARVRHANVLAVHGADVADGRAGIWCDLLEGHTLEQLVMRHGAIAPSTVVELALPLTEALHQVHNKAMSHGDVKPANIMIEPDGTPVLMDFGAVQAALADDVGYGSPLVMAPEQLAGQPASPSSDWYALGCTFYYALTGRYPIEAETVERLQHRHQRGSSIDLSTAPRAWRTLFARMLDPNPSSRIGARELTDRLQRLKTRKQRLRKQFAVGVMVGSLAIAAVASGWAAYATKRDAKRLEQIREVYVEALDATNLIVQSGPASLEPFFDNLSAQSERKLADYPKAQGQILSMVSNGYFALDKPERSLDVAQRGLQLMLRSGEVSNDELAVAWANISAGLRETERLDESEEAATTALSLLDGSTHPEAAKVRLIAFNNLAILHDRRGSVHESIAAHQRMLDQRIALHGPNSESAAEDYFRLAYAQYDVGQTEQAMSNFQRAEQLLRTHGAGESVRMAFVKHGLADAFGAYDTAAGQRYIDEARQLFLASLPADDSRLLWLKLTELRIWRAAGRFEQVEPAISELSSRSTLPTGLANPTYKLLAATQVDLQRWPEAAKTYAALLATDNRKYRRFRPFYRAALAYCNYRTDPVRHPSPHTELVAARNTMAQAGFERIAEYSRLGQWLATVGGPLPATDNVILESQSKRLDP